MTHYSTVPCCDLDDHHASEENRTGAAVRNGLGAIAVWPIRMYRRFLSPLKRGPSCRFLPSCSEYAENAIRTRGVVVGGMLALWRLLRCNPFVRGGYDPVPLLRGKVHAGPR